MVRCVGFGSIKRFMFKVYFDLLKGYILDTFIFQPFSPLTFHSIKVCLNVADIVQCFMYRNTNDRQLTMLNFATLPKANV